MYLPKPHVTLAGVDISAKIKGVTLNVGRQEFDDSKGGTDTVTTGLGRMTWDGQLVLEQNFADNDLDEDLWDIVVAGVAVAIAIRPTTDAVGVTNPSYAGNVVIPSFTPVSGNVGDDQVLTVPFKAAGAIARGTA